MGERYLNIINISLILSTLYCSYSYVNLDKSTRQKNINYILTLNLIYNLIGILNINLDKKPIYMLASTSSIYLIIYIKNNIILKNKKNIYMSIFYFLNIFFIMKIILSKSIYINLGVFPIGLNLLNLYIVAKDIKFKNSIWVIGSIIVYFLAILTKYKFIYSISSIINIINTMIIFKNIVSKNLYKTSLKQKHISEDMKILKENLKDSIEQIKANRLIIDDTDYKLFNKNKILDTILNQSNKCVLIIDKDGYISNEDDTFTNLWKEYKNYKYKIKLAYFLKNSIKNDIEILLDIQKVYDLGITFKGEMIGNDGRHFECNYAPFKVNKQTMGVICVINDITYKKQSQNQISENQIKYKKIIETIPYNILLTSEENITYSNNNENSINIYDKNLKHIIMDTAKKGEISYICEKGNENHIIINKTSFLEDNQVNNLVIIRDISKYVNLLENIKISKEKYKSLVNSIPEGIYMWDMNKEGCLYGNEKIFEIMEAETLRDINNSDIKSKIETTLFNTNDCAKFIRHKVKSTKGKELYVELSNITMEINKNLKGIGIIRDVTEEVKAENIEKEVRRKKLEYKQKNDFFVNMSHELKTPLNLITSTNQLLQSVYRDEIINNPKGEIARVTNIVKKQTYTSLSIIENILTLSKLESDFYESNLDCYDIISVIEDIAMELNRHIKNNDIEIIFDTNVEEKVMSIDPHDIEKIIMATLSKIIKKSNRNSIIYIYICEYDKGLNISIENKGRYNLGNCLSNQSKETIDMNIEVARSILKLYQGNLNIIENENDIKIEIDMSHNNKVDYYDKKQSKLNTETIFAEYSRINAL